MVCDPIFCHPLRMYEIALSRVERIQQYSNKYLRKWLWVPPCFSKVGSYTNSENLELPIYLLVEEFKIGKVRLQMMMKDSANEIIRKAYPEIKSGTEWSAVKGAQEAECSQRIKGIIGVTKTNRATRYSLKSAQREKEIWWAKKSGCLRRSKEQPLLLLRPNYELEQNGMILNQLNYRGNPELQWNH